MRTLSLGLIAATALVVGIASAGSEPIRIETSTPAQTQRHVPSWLSGVWTRDWIEERGRRSSTLDVHYLQTPTFFADVRIPLDRPKFPHAGAFADLSDQELHALAQQRGFAGNTTLVGGIATWHHQVDFQPPDGAEDAGRLESTAKGRMYELGLNDDYTESWRSVTDGKGRFLAIQTLSGDRTQRLLLVADDHFLYVRNRRNDLPPAQSLDYLIRSTHATRAQIIEYLDCEFSFGRIRGGAMSWEILRSTLPWHEGQRLEFVDQVQLIDGGTGIRLHTPQAERATVPINTLSPAELAAFFGGGH
jgi:hypothetical protein